MTAAKSGVIANFVTGYLQREIRLMVTVAGGTDLGLRDGKTKGFAVGRLVKIADGALTAATDLSDATHIIAQSDDTIRELSICGDPERYSSLPNLVCANSEKETVDGKEQLIAKTVAVYKIIDKDDIQLVTIKAGE